VSALAEKSTEFCSNNTMEQVVKIKNIYTDTCYVPDGLTGCVALRGGGALNLACQKDVGRVLHGDYEGC
jgi:hypothetical protein